MQMIRNHAEAIVKNKKVKSISNMIGYNFRMGEIEAAIGIEQLKKLRTFLDKRQIAANYLTAGLKTLDGLKTPVVKDNNEHAYYIYPIIIDRNKININRELIVKSLSSEGVPGLINGFINLHLYPIYQRKIAYGSKGFPWSSEICRREVDYNKGICPVAEELHDHSFIGFEICLFDLEIEDCDLIIKAFKKVWNNMDFLK